MSDPTTSLRLVGHMALTLLIAAAALALGAASARAADPVIAATGDIACDPSDSNFNNGNGTSTACRQRYTADLVSNAGLSTVLVLGDNQYDNGTLSKYRAAYDASWGRVKSITRPVPGNHEPGDASGYYDYFNGTGVNDGPAGRRGKGWYSYDVGGWHLIALNSKCDRIDCTAGGEQEQWLRADLTTHSGMCTLAYWHHARFSSGHDGDNLFAQPFWQALADAEADVVINGHSHNYERLAPMDASGNADPSRGIRAFVVGTGGAFFTGVGSARPNSLVRQNHTYGVLKLTLHPSSYDWQFVPEAGRSFTDSGSDSCHHSSGAPPIDTQAPSVPTSFTGGAASSTRVDLTWGASTDDVGVTGYEILRNGTLVRTTSGTSYADTSVSPATTYIYQVRALDAAGNRSALSNAATVTTPPNPDTQPPTAPTSLAGTAISPTQVDLTWGASTDNVGVAGYEIFRDGVFLATSTGTGYSDPSASPSTTHVYAVRALDAAGNRSGFGNTVTVSTTEGTLTLAPEADARVEQSSPSTNYGASYLRTDGGGDPDVDSYLKFAVSGISGSVKSAKLRVNASSSTVDGPAVYMTGTGWSEGGITWANRPPPTSGATDDKGAISSNIWVEYDVTQFVTGSGTYSFRLATTSSDGLEFRSREDPDAGSRPELVLKVERGSHDGSVPPSRSGSLPSPPASLLAPGSPFSPLGAARVPPRLVLGGSRIQRLVRQGLIGVARCDRPCTVSATARISLERPSRSFRSRKVERTLGGNERRMLRLRFSRSAVRAVRRALRRKQRLVATLIARARDAAGSSSSAQRRIRVKR